MYFTAMIPYQDTRRGLHSVNRIVDNYNIEGVYGPILELIDCEEKFFTAVEVTAGNRY
jgi:structural maintenance of chromosome 3 (chondroitin sulfate proteoglycan 6)